MGFTVRKAKVTIRLMEDLLGTVPMNKDVYATYIESKRPAPPEGENHVDAETETVTEDLETRGWTSFHQDDEGVFLYDYVVKGFIKNAANVLKDQLAIKNLRSKLTDNIFVFPRRLHLGKEMPDGLLERPLRGMTAQGPRVSLARSSTVNAGTEISFEIRMIPHKEKEINWQLIRDLLEYGQYSGLGQFRNGGYGRFEVVSFEEQADK
jgi:hypothetical protein